MNLPNLVERIIAPLSAAALSVFAALDAFSAPPIALSQNPDTILDSARVLKWLTLVFVGIIWILYLRRRTALRRFFGLRFIVLAAATSLLLLIAEHRLLEHWTVAYTPEQSFRIVVGERLTPVGRNYVETGLCQNGDAHCLLQGVGGESSKLWEESELTQRQRTLVILRAATFCTSLLALIAIAYAIALSSRTRETPANP